MKSIMIYGIRLPSHIRLAKGQKSRIDLMKAMKYTKSMAIEAIYRYHVLATIVIEVSVD